MDKKDLINFLKSEEIRRLLSEIGVQHLYLIGSYSRGDNNETSDIDLIYEKNKKTRIGGIKFIRNKSILEKKLNKKVDLVNYNYIYNDLKSFIDNDKILIY